MVTRRGFLHGATVEGKGHSMTLANNAIAVCSQERCNILEEPLQLALHGGDTGLTPNMARTNVQLFQ